jgi:hypothetical protein
MGAAFARWARLIAAAPDLLEALVEMLATHRRRSRYRDAGAIDRTDNRP